MQILDLRQLSSRSLEPLFVEEARQWRQELHWDYRPSLELIRKFVDSRALRGAVAIDEERPAGYGFYVLEERKGLMGGSSLLRMLPNPRLPGRYSRKCWKRCGPRRESNGWKRN